MSRLAESDVEDAALELFTGLGYAILRGPDIAPGELFTERTSYSDVVLVGRLRQTLARINPKIPSEAIEEAIRKILSTESPSLVENNRRFHRFLTDGINVEHRGEGRIVYDQVKLFDPDEPANNDWLAVNQFTVIEDKNNRRPDVVILLTACRLPCLN